MKRFAAQPSRMMRTALLLLLIAAQSAVYAHELVHQANNDTSICSICSMSSNLGAAAVDSPVSAWVIEHSAEPLVQPLSCPLAGQQNAHPARAPPASSRF